MIKVKKTFNKLPVIITDKSMTPARSLRKKPMINAAAASPGSPNNKLKAGETILLIHCIIPNEIQ